MENGNNGLQKNVVDGWLSGGQRDGDLVGGMSARCASWSIFCVDNGTDDRVICCHSISSCQYFATSDVA